MCLSMTDLERRFSRLAEINERAASNNFKAAARHRRFMIRCGIATVICWAITMGLAIGLFFRPC